MNGKGRERTFPMYLGLFAVATRQIDNFKSDDKIYSQESSGLKICSLSFVVFLLPVRIVL